MRARHICTRDSAVSVPASNAALSWAMVAASTSMVLLAATGASATRMVAASAAALARRMMVMEAPARRNPTRCARRRCYDPRRELAADKKGATVAGRDNNPNSVSRREFGTRAGAAAAGLALGGGFLTRPLGAAPHVGGRIIGANDRVLTASIGIRGQGN